MQGLLRHSVCCAGSAVAVAVAAAAAVTATHLHSMPREVLGSYFLKQDAVPFVRGVRDTHNLLPCWCRDGMLATLDHNVFSPCDTGNKRPLPGESPALAQRKSYSASSERCVVGRYNGCGRKTVVAATCLA
jgi:hypothetical protein